MVRCSAEPALWVRTVLLAVGLATPLGCGDDSDGGDAPPPPAEDALLLAIDAGDGAPPAAYRVLLQDEEGLQGVSCPQPTEPQAKAPRCTADGLVLQDIPAGLQVTVKALGWRTLRVELELDPKHEAAGVQRRELRLSPLPPVEATDDFCTGFEAEGGLQAFEAMAHAFSTELGPSFALKFYLELDGPDGRPHVWFQNTRRHPIHYEFVRGVVGRALSLREFEEATYRGAERRAMAGTLVLYPAVQAPIEALGGASVSGPVTLNFFPSDDLSPALVQRAYGLIEERLGFAPRVGDVGRLAYLPAGERQEEELRAAVGELQGSESLWLWRSELYGGRDVQILNPGLAYGTLRRMSPEELDQAVVSFSDVLVLTRLPNVLPIVGGTITEEWQTPLAHVNVAARTRGTPNIAHLGARDDTQITELLGELVRFEVVDGKYSIEATTLDEARAVWDSRSREPFTPPFDLSLQELRSFDELEFSDSQSVGVKAANLAELRRLLGERAPDGFAVPFWYYDRFLHDTSIPDELCGSARDDCLQEGRDVALCDQARARCGLPDGEPEVLWAKVGRLFADEDVQADSRLREASLDGLRWVMRHVEVAPELGAALDDRVEEVFGGGRVRLRSSTNAEDLENFSGAGLYSSVSASGRGDDAPSREIRKVWASVFNWRAVEERSFWSIDHGAVRMGVAVHQTFPDEAANGVLITQNIADTTVAGMYVNVQRGETAVTNPEDGALPEIFSIIPAPAGLQVARQRFSSLSPDQPILSDGEVAALYSAAAKVQRHFAQLYGANPYALALDLEFKLHGPERALYVKQVRPYSVGGR